MYVVILGVLAKFQLEQLITFQGSALPAVSRGRYVLCLPCKAGLVVKQLSLPPQRRVVSEVVRTLPASLRGAACKVIWDKRHPVNVRSFTTGDSKLSITRLLNHCLAQDKMGSDCVFLKSCSWMGWHPLKPCQRDVFILFLFFWNPFSLFHLLQDLTPLLRARYLSGCLHS